jgi:hypothetical protein
MTNKLHLIRSTVRLNCVWVPTGNARMPLACVWVCTGNRQSGAAPPDSEAGRLHLCA